jgi:peptidoglycan/LPS O-acetylase OafA/YrhL
MFARGGGWLSRLLASRPLAYLGEISYAFYMLHMPVISYCLVRGKSFGFHDWAWQGKWAFVTVWTLALSVACYHLYEIPLRDRCKRALSLGRAPAPNAIPPATRVEPPARRAA